MDQRNAGQIQSDDKVVEVARSIGKSNRDREVRLVAITSALILAALGILLVLGLAAYNRQNDLLEEIKAQNEELDNEFEENRIARALEAEQLEDILEGIQGRLIPRSDVTLLQREVRILTREVDVLTRETRELNRSLRRFQRSTGSAVSGGG